MEQSFGFRGVADGFKFCGSWDRGRMLSDCWCFVGDAVGEIRTDKYTGGNVLGLLLRLTGYSHADFAIFSAVWVNFSNLSFSRNSKRYVASMSWLEFFLYPTESFF